MSVIDRLAEWVSSLEYEDIPERVREVARNQLASVIGAIHAGAGCAGGKAVTSAVESWDSGGPCARYPGAVKGSWHSSLLQNCSLSMALDYDDYLFLGHSGHSAVCVPLAVCEMSGSDTRTALVAQVAANELEGRLGASVVLGPHNGQMWSHIHLLGSAAAASRVLGLDSERTANAMGIAMSQPVYALFPGFMGPQSKLLTAATPAVTGTAAALLASEGMTGSRSIIEDPQGFWAHFSFIPLPFMMTGLGSAWVTDTIAFKPYPGCAYIDTAMDALFEMMGEFRQARGRDIESGEVRSVEVEASLLTVAMDGMSRAYMDPVKLSPTNINFSLSVSVAIGLLSGELSGAQLTEAYLDRNREEILGLASRVELRHDAGLSVRFMRSFDEAVDLKAMLAQLDFKALVGARRRLGAHLSGVATMGRAEAISAWRSLSREDRSFLRGLVSLGGLLGRAPAYDLGSSRLEELLMPFGAHVKVRLKDGSELEAEKLIPRGAPGDPGRLAVPREKFTREASGFLGAGRAAEAMEALSRFDGRSLADLHETLSAP